MDNNGFVDDLVKSVFQRKMMPVDDGHPELRVVFVIGNDGGVKYKDALLRRLRAGNCLIMKSISK